MSTALYSSKKFNPFKEVVSAIIDYEIPEAIEDIIAEYLRQLTVSQLMLESINKPVIYHLYKHKNAWSTVRRLYSSHFKRPTKHNTIVNDRHGKYFGEYLAITNDINLFCAKCGEPLHYNLALCQVKCEYDGIRPQPRRPFCHCS